MRLLSWFVLLLSLCGCPDAEPRAPTAAPTPTPGSADKPATRPAKPPGLGDRLAGTWLLTGFEQDGTEHSAERFPLRVTFSPGGGFRWQVGEHDHAHAPGDDHSIRGAWRVRGVALELTIPAAGLGGSDKLTLAANLGLVPDDPTAIKVTLAGAALSLEGERAGRVLRFRKVPD